jgi:DNA-binding transcriptional LysR family regulator
MDTNKIRAILSAVRQGSLSRAAEEYSYTPSAMSHIADALDAELGVKLLRRTHAGVTLTEEGEILLEKLEALLRLEDEIRETASALAEKNAEHLKIGSYASISLYVLPEVLRTFKEKYPQTKISITVSDNFADCFETEDFDIVLGGSNPRRRGEEHPFMRDDFVAVVPEGLFWDRESVSREELYPHAFIMTNESVLHQYFEIPRFREVIRFTSADDMSVISMVKEGVGVAVLPALSVTRREAGVRILRLEPTVFRTLTYTCNPTRKKDRTLMRFVRLLKEFFPNIE